MTLEEKHRKAQLVLRAATLRDLLKLWPAFDLNDIPRTWPAFETAVLLLIKARGTTSSALARAYYREYRRDSGLDVPRLEPANMDKAAAGLTVVGEINAAKQLAQGRPIEEVEKTSLVLVSGEVTRHVFNAGRATLLGALAAESKVFGRESRWRRQTDSNPCPWCSEQSRFTFPTTMSFSAHSHCACFPVPA